MGAVEMQIEVFSFSRDHVIKGLHDLVGWVLHLQVNILPNLEAPGIMERQL